MIPRAVPGGTAEGVIGGDDYAVHWDVPFSVVLVKGARFRWPSQCAYQMLG